ncbi:hypothetical protein [uncultured Thomasclavelia sp.]|uniref:hypothetical protein n=1 Tax=uncultured Thomasclavelia sp. TaxID=3025759 RepID=UPI0025F0BC72|nr:hypothetical protein [uncultured Thomasclavelia sp.]
MLPQAPLKDDGTIRSYKLQEKVASGKPLNDQEAYDKIKIVTIYTSNKHVISKKYEENDALLRPVMLLFGMNGASAREIRKILENEYKFKMSAELKEGVENMCNLAQGLIIENRVIGRDEGRIEGKEEEKYKILINLLEQTDISLDKIMRLVGLVKSEEIAEMTKRLIEDLRSKEGYINGKPTTITIERIINEKKELV